MAKPKLTNDDFCRSARRLKCEPAAVKAVSFVESRGEGFYSDGFPVILFERHIFRKYTQGRYNRTHPHLSGPAGNYGAAGQNQRNKFNEAFALNPDAAMKSCSWGKFQIMGFNHSICGFSTVGAFVDAMKESEGRHLDAFTSFVIGNHLGKYLRNLNWAAFAEGYNGAGYRKNAYDTKMATAYKRFSKENIDCSNSAAASDAQTPTGNKQDEGQGNSSSQSNQSGQEQSGSPPIETVTLKSVGTSLMTKVVAFFAMLTGMGINAGTIVETKLSELTLNHVAMIALGVAVMVLAVFYYRKRQEAADLKDKMLIEKAADPQQNTVEMKRRGWIEWS